MPTVEPTAAQADRVHRLFAVGVDINEISRREGLRPAQVARLLRGGLGSVIPARPSRMPDRTAIEARRRQVQAMLAQRIGVSDIARKLDTPAEVIAEDVQILRTGVLYQERRV